MSDGRRDAIDLFFLTIGLSFAAAVVTFVVSLWFVLDARIDEMRRIADRRCLQIRLLSELHCNAIREIEVRSKIGVAKTECAHERIPNLFECPGVLDAGIDIAWNDDEE